MKVTLVDLLSKKPEEVLLQMRTPAEDTKESVDETQSESQKEVTAKPKIDREIYKGKFSLTFVFEKGQRHQFDGHDLEVINVEKSSGRIRFLKSDTQEIFSLPISVLTGQEAPMPYKKGDWVIFEGRKVEIKGLNPASRNVVVELEGKTRYVKVSKVAALPESDLFKNSD